MTTNAIVKSAHLNFDGKDYFRGGAEDILLGSYGEKKTPLLKMNYLEVQSRIPPHLLNVREAIEVSIDFSKSETFSFSRSMHAAGTIDGIPIELSTSATAGAQLLRDGHLKLVKLVVDNEDLRTAVMNAPGAVSRLASYGKDARIVNQVFVVVEARLAQALTASGSVKASVSTEVNVDGGLIKLSITKETAGGVNHTTTVTLSKGSVFAYLLVHIDWHKRSKTIIDKLSDDQWGLS